MGYADETTKYEDSGKRGKILVREPDNWKYVNKFYGGEPCSGNKTLWLNDNDVFR